MKVIILFSILSTAIAEMANLYTIAVPRYFLASTTLNELAFFAGGQDANQNVFDSINIYNITANNWTFQQLTVPRYGLTAVSNCNLVFIAGGLDNNGNSRNTVDYYNYTSNIWKITALSQPRNFLASTYLNGLMLFGGGQSTFISTSQVVDIYNCATGEWTLSQLSTPRASLGATSLPNFGLAFFSGGRNVIGLATQVVDIYNQNNGNWTTIQLQVERFNHASVSLPSKGLVFFAGGQNGLFNLLNSIEIFNANTMSWQPIAQLSIGRTNLAGLSINSKGMVFFGGGQSIKGSSNAVDIYIDGNIQTSILQTGSTMLSATAFEKQEILIFAGGQDSNGNAIAGISTKSINQPGFYTTINPTQINLCQAGMYCPGFTAVPIICPAGNYCPQGSSQPIPCPAGTYQINQGSPTLLLCTKCLAGTYNSLSGQSSQSSCISCAIGYYCPLGSVSPSPCESNYFCPNPADKFPCSTGYYYDGIFATLPSSCKQCEPGNACPGNGESKTTCSVGSYASSVGLAYCSTCSEGYYCPYATVNPIICPVNTFSQKGSGGCTPCPNGQYNEKAGSVTCKTCTISIYDTSGWKCLSNYERVIFVFVWLGTIISAIITVIKIYYFIKNRLNKIKENGFNKSFYNFIFLEKILDNRNESLTLMQTEFYSEETIKRQEFDKLNKIVMNLQKKIENI